MTKTMTVEWLDPATAAGRGAAQAPFARALVCDLRDPALAPLRTAAPDAGDRADVDYPGASDRTYFLARRVTLRSFAARCAGVAPHDIRIFYDEHGAPRIAGRPGLFVSASGRGARAVLAVATSPIGVDFEPCDPSTHVIEDVLSASERPMLAKLDTSARRRAFLRIWTAKEAYLKALGRGFKRDPALVTITLRAGGFTVGDGGFATDLAAGVFAPPGSGEDMIAACVVLAPAREGTAA